MMADFLCLEGNNNNICKDPVYCPQIAKYPPRIQSFFPIYYPQCTANQLNGGYLVPSIQTINQVFEGWDRSTGTNE